ncbi:DUF350 domain-containing protein [Nocardiopsis suaedae]|uniref:DUF350 domain-containing protein n=1 Tax=Nocardiopsis suaedae TaxID=3018444 RepID=A0ABT4TR02_9ACTN|nr:DUF350 domain-containing protein [Nocardiopsis suaedae]MDA2806811.1 DUF350 domain-containing protein [Nocardiopsis suaedae]
MFILYEALAVFAYGALGLVLMLAGYLIVDLLTPGKLHVLIWQNRNPNATLVLAANTLGVAMVVAMAIYASDGGLAEGLMLTAVYGVIGLVLMALSFAAIDLLTPGRLGDAVNHTELVPAAWVNATAHVSVALVVAAAIS